MSEFRRRLMMAQGGKKEIPNYLCFTALEDGTFTFTYGSSVGTGGGNATSISYSTDGINWTTLNNVASQTVSITTPTIAAGGKVYWKGTNGRMSMGTSANQYSYFSSTGMFDASGDVRSILFNDNFESSNIPIWRYYIFTGLFRSSKVVSAKNLKLLDRADASNIFLYAYMFGYCSNLTETPIIPNVCPGRNSFESMFRSCTSLVVPPALPLTDFKGQTGMYTNMFGGCTALASCPELQCLTLTTSCYEGMFDGCRMTATCSLPATTLAERCYCKMFARNPNLVTITPLNAVTLAKECYMSMFEACTSLVTAPVIAATTLAQNCYKQMFYNCTSLTTIPPLYAEALVTGCYSIMFRNTKVNYIKALFLTQPTTSYTQGWVQDIPNVSTSIFVKHIDATWTDTGDSAVPSNWTVIYYDPSDDKYYTSQDKSQECDDHGNPI